MLTPVPPLATVSWFVRESEEAVREPESVALPLPRMEKSVALLVEATTKSGTVGADCVVVETESEANGLVVPMPTTPPLLLYTLLPERVHGVLMVKEPPPTRAPGS